MSDRISLYADALLSVVAAEGNVNVVLDELKRFSMALESSDELRETLADPHIPSERRVRITEDLLQGKASDTTNALVSMVVGTGRIKELPGMVDQLQELTATRTNTTIAEVRSAVELTDDQRRRLAEALKASTGRDIDVIVVVDPSIMGGVVTQIGDTVIDGSVRHRLAQLRETF